MSYRYSYSRVSSTYPSPFPRSCMSNPPREIKYTTTFRPKFSSSSSSSEEDLKYTKKLKKREHIEAEVKIQNKAEKVFEKESQSKKLLEDFFTKRADEDKLVLERLLLIKKQSRQKSDRERDLWELQFRASAGFPASIREPMLITSKRRRLLELESGRRPTYPSYDSELQDLRSYFEEYDGKSGFPDCNIF